MKTLRHLPTGVTELGCHPGEDEQLDSVYRTERLQEVKVLCDPQVRKAVESNAIELCSFHNLPGLQTQPATA